MIRTRVLFWFWVVVGVITWNATFDLLVSRGVKEYLYRSAAYEARLGPPVTMDEIMQPTIRDGAVTASIAAGLVTLAGWATIALLVGKTARRDREGRRRE